MRRVFKPGGKLLFVEYDLSPEESVRRWQDRLTPIWKRIGGGCHLNLPIRSLIETAGFSITQIDTGYMWGLHLRRTRPALRPTGFDNLSLPGQDRMDNLLKAHM